MVPRLFLMLWFVPVLCHAVPIASSDAVTMRRGQKALIDVLANDTGSLDPGTVEIVQAPQFGTASVDGTGRILYTQSGGQPAGDTFQYRVGGPDGLSPAAEVTVTFTNSLRVPPSGFALPAAPPPTRYEITPAFGGLPFTVPTALASPSGDTRRLFVCQRDGQIRLIPDVTAPEASSLLFLDLAEVLAGRTGETIGPGQYTESGLLGLAFHPNHQQNGYFYVFYTVNKEGLEFQRLSRFSVQAANVNAADPASELILLEQFDREANHNGGDLHFGPDGYLYFSAGDEGDQYDPHQNSQRIDLNFFSGVFRIDVDKRPGNLEPNAHSGIPRDGGIARYSVPADNPFVAATTYGGLPVDPAKVRTEFWATGLRSPWRFSFDSVTGELWLGDVGQYDYEEFNLITRGGNYGWIHRNGRRPGFRTPPPGFTATYIDPVHEYPHVELGGDPSFNGNSAIGGVVYRGTRFASLNGAYVCGDWISGNVWAIRREANGSVQVERIGGLPRVAAFGIDPSNGDVLLIQHNFGTASLYRLTGARAATGFPETLSATGLFADLADLSPNPGLVPYEPNLAFWSDHAVKRRWLSIPTGSQITWARDGSWAFPNGAVWVKHFDLETERGNPATKKRIETRVLVKNAAGIYGVSYRWNPAQTEATLAPEEGETFDVPITEDSATFMQRWQIPSRADCTACHNGAAGYALSVDTRQLNRVATIQGITGNQLDLLNASGFFSNAPDPASISPRHVRPDETEFTVEARVRSYLAVNCSYCHRPEGGAPPTWDGRPQHSLADTHLIHGVAQDNGGTSTNRLVVPGDTTASILLNRLVGSNGFSRMPPLGTSVIDKDAIALLTQWINADLEARQTYDRWRMTEFGSTSDPKGAPESDPDMDGRRNATEFLLGTAPNDGTSTDALVPLVTADDNITLSLDLPTNRAFQVETSTDLVNWSIWEAHGNDGVPRSARVQLLIAPRTAPQQFFRVRVWEP